MKCLECGKLVSQLHGIQRHFKLYHKSSELNYEEVTVESAQKENTKYKFECDFCPVKYSRLCHLTAHTARPGS